MKKELAFANKQIYNKRVQSEGAGPNQANNANNFSVELENSMKLVETVTMQKRQLEDENNDLKSRLSEMVNERGTNLSGVMDRPMSQGQPGPQNRGVPPLHLHGQAM